MKRIAILRCGKLPSFVTWEVPNLDELFEEDNYLLRGFREQGLAAQSVVWNEPVVDWEQYDLALIRSTWDYLDERERFLAVLAQIEASSCRLFNPLEAVRWNIDKHYLFDLKSWDIPIIPTYTEADIESGEARRSAAIGDGEQTVILKPALGLAGAYTYRVRVDELETALAQIKSRHPASQYLVQPFIESVLTEGEWSFVYFGRRLSHVLLKKPAANDYRVQGIYGGSIQAVAPLPSDLRQAEALMDKIPHDVLYARLDFVRVGGRLSVMEIELIEPIFSFHLVPESVARLVEATRARLEAAP